MSYIKKQPTHKNKQDKKEGVDCCVNKAAEENIAASAPK